MEKKSRSGITINNQPLETVVETIENSQPDEYTSESKTPSLYHRPKLTYRSKGRSGKVIHNIHEINVRMVKDRVIEAIKEKDVARAIVAVLLTQKQPISGHHITSKIQECLKEHHEKFYFKPYSVRTCIGIIKKSKLNEVFNASMNYDLYKKRVMTYQITDPELNFMEAVNMLMIKTPKKNDKPPVTKPKIVAKVVESPVVNPPIEQEIHFKITISINIETNMG